MEEYNRDSLRALRREAIATPKKRKGGRWITFIIILLLILAGGFIIATKIGFDPSDAKTTASEWSREIKDFFNKKEANDITEIVDSVLAEQDVSV